MLLSFEFSESAADQALKEAMEREPHDPVQLGDNNIPGDIITQQGYRLPEGELPSP